MIKEAIILAGGFGKRLQPVVSDKPKCLASVAGNPFLYYLINYLQSIGIESYVFSVGYLHEMIEEYLRENYTDLNYQISLENKPLGTGGGIKLACKKTSATNVLICNGDTLYKIDLEELSVFNKRKDADCTLNLKPMKDFDRFGMVELNDDNSVKAFKEKQFYKSGLINGGVYALNAERFLKESLPEKFSFEKEYLEKNVNTAAGKTAKLFGMVQDTYFIDIGIPEDFERANKELKIEK